MPSLLLSCLPAVDPETDAITAVIETPKGSSPNTITVPKAPHSGFATYNKAKGRVFEVLARSGPKNARKLVEQGIGAFRTSRTDRDHRKAA